MTVLDVPVPRVLTPEEAGALIGTEVPPATIELLPSPRRDGDVVRVVDDATGEVVALITRLDRLHRATLRSAVTHMDIKGNAVHRAANRMQGAGQTFGYAPKRVLVGYESCRVTNCASDHPDEHQVLTTLGGDLADEFAGLLPDRFAADREVLDGNVHHDWLMDDRALWTSGVVNRSATLPYHRDGANFHTWSAMPTLRYQMDGGRLHVPEYNVVFPCRDGEVTWFCGKDLVHGVTPMSMKTPEAYRYSVVYYAMQGMKNCREYAEETALAAQRRTERERRMADDVRAKLAAAAEQVQAEAEDVRAMHGGVTPSPVTQ